VKCAAQIQVANYETEKIALDSAVLWNDGGRRTTGDDCV